MAPHTSTKWTELWQKLGVKGAQESQLDALVAHYSEPHRAYHNLAHISDCLEQFEPVRSYAHNPEAVELAIWYHDVIYDPRAKDNEERSAEVAVRTAGEAGLPASFQGSVKALILATKKHDASLDRDAALMVDVDLSILGREPDRFDQYEGQIRQEYDWVSEEAFTAGRTAVLESFLARPAVYGTEFFKNRYERQARENIERSIRNLRRQER